MSGDRAGDRDCVVVAVARTPFGRFNGALRNIATAQLGALTVDTLMERSGLAPERIDALYAGVGMIAGAVLTPARQMVLQSRLPQQTPSMTVDRACCSGMTAIGLAAREIALGDAECVIAGGAESLSNTPRLLPRSPEARPGRLEIEDPLTLRAPFLDEAIASYTGREAMKHGIDRRQQDEWALASHERYFAAEAAGYFAFERAPVGGNGGRPDAPLLERDESPRRDSSLEKLGGLKAVYGGPTVTAGNAPGLNDGAAFLLLASRAFARRHGLAVLARLCAYAQVAGTPTSGSYTPADAIGKLLERSGATVAGLDLIEINEAYAATPLVSTLRLAANDHAAAERLRVRTNVHGGAVAIGHPLGASGARIVMTLINGLRRRGGGQGTAAICGGFGQGDAVLLQVTDNEG